MKDGLKIESITTYACFYNIIVACAAKKNILKRLMDLILIS